MIYPYTEKTRYEEPIDDVKEINVHFASINEYTTTKLNSNGDKTESIKTVFRDIDGKTQDIIETYGNQEVSIGTGEMIEHLQCVSTIDDYVEYKEYWYDHSLSNVIDTFYIIPGGINFIQIQFHKTSTFSTPQKMNRFQFITFTLTIKTCEQIMKIDPRCICFL